jgi:5-methylcytosine-specific restriction endonuclease McrA
MCFNKPRVPIALNSRIGKTKAKWMKVRGKWMQDNAPADGYWYCHYCGTPLTTDTLTLDHIIARSKRPDLRYAMTNLIPCCYFDNSQKGSLSYKQYVKKYYPNLLESSSMETLNEVSLVDTDLS